jgi:hypothetical protein
MSEVSIEEYLNTPMGKVPEPPQLPPGDYIGTIMKHEFKKVTPRNTGVESTRLQLSVKIAQAQENVDPDLLSKLDVTKEYVYPDFNLSDPKGRKALDKFLVSLFGENAEGSGISAYLPLMAQRHVQFGIKHTPGVDKDGNSITYINVNGLKGLPQD